MTPDYQLAQINIGKLRRPRAAPEMRSYREALAPVTAIAVAWPGFIWIHDDSIVELAVEAFGTGMAANLSVWRDIESLQGFMTCREHASVMARKVEWFVPSEDATFALWWVRLGHRPGLNEGRNRLMHLRREGPTQNAFDLDNPFPPPSEG